MLAWLIQLELLEPVGPCIHLLHHPLRIIIIGMC